MSGPLRALLRADEIDVFALSTPVDAEIALVLNRPKFAEASRPERQDIRVMTTWNVRQQRWTASVRYHHLVWSS
jgi:hypothetical protein